MVTRRWILKLHLYLGLIPGLMLVFVGLTGSLLVFSDEIDEMLNPEILRVTPGPALATLDDIITNVARCYPGHKLLRIRMPLTKEGVYELWMNSDKGLRIYVNPYTGAILGSRLPTRTFKGMLFYLHSQLLLGEPGKIVMGITAIFSLLLTVTGLVLWWPGYTNLRRGFAIKWSGSWKRLNFDFHKLMGICSALFLGVSAVTGIYLVFHTPFERAVNWLTADPPRPQPPRSTIQENGIKPSLDRVLQSNSEKLPNAQITWIYLPATPTATINIRKKLPEELHPNGRCFIYIDQYSGETLMVEDALSSPFGTRFINSMYPIHIGRLSGLTTRILLVFVGLFPAILFITGLVIWRNRIKPVA